MCLAVPGKVLSIAGDDPVTRMARVDFGGIVKEVNMACVSEARVGDYVLVHVGMALSTIDEAEAREVFEYLRQMGDLAELEEPAADAADNASPGSVS
jgi:hydrogenase expression/formation protein HypC